VKFAVTLGRMHPRIWAEAAEAADRLGFDSVWLPEHLVLPVAMAGSPFAEAEHPPIPPTTQLFDAASMLSFLAARTTRIRLGTYVYLLGLRHPFITARAFATLDWLSGGRAVIGAGAGWLESEWRALGVDPARRGARFDEAIAVCRRLWSEETVAHDGPHFSFAEVAFEPKPPQGSIPILVGGESERALRRAGTLGDGWIGMGHTPESAAAMVATLRGHREEAGRLDERFEVVVGGVCTTEDDVAAWEDAGVDCLIVTPWTRSAEVFDSMASLAARLLGRPSSPGEP
jgi:probable F420-dependent oxidoreductase